MPTTSTAIEDAEKAGFDLSLMDASFSYSCEKRAIQPVLHSAIEADRLPHGFARLDFQFHTVEGLYANAYGNVPHSDHRRLGRLVRRNSG